MSGNIKKLFEAIIEEVYLLNKTIEHIINLLDIDTALVASGTNQVINTQLDYLLNIINRERWEDETDTSVRNRLNGYVEEFYGGGTLTQYRNSILSKYPSVNSGDIRIQEPTNIYPDPSVTYTNYSKDITFIEQPPDQTSWIYDETLRYYLSGAAPSGTGIWRTFKFFDASQLSSYQLEMLDNQSASVEGASGAIEAIVYDKCTTPFTGIMTGVEQGLKNGLLYEDEDISFQIVDIDQVETPFTFGKTREKKRQVYNPDLLIEFLKLSTHNTMFEVVE